MKTKPKYFRVTVTAGSVQERDMRIESLTVKGFEVVRYFDCPEIDYTKRTDIVGGKFVRLPNEGSVKQARVGAVLQRASNE